MVVGLSLKALLRHPTPEMSQTEVGTGDFDPARGEEVGESLSGLGC